jgi:hypothetical protein
MIIVTALILVTAFRPIRASLLNSASKLEWPRIAKIERLRPARLSDAMANRAKAPACFSLVIDETWWICIEGGGGTHRRCCVR